MPSARPLLLFTVVGIVLLVVPVPALYAQADSVIAIGVAASIYQNSDSRAHNPVGVGIIGRLRRGDGIGVTVGLDWYDSEVKTDIGGQPTLTGTVRIRPIMAGIGYSRQYARFQVQASVVAGWAFNSMHASDEGKRAFSSRLGVRDVGFHASNCFAIRPDFSVWYELGNHIGVVTSLSYMGARPRITTTSANPLARRSETINTSAVMLTLGVAYGVF